MTEGTKNADISTIQRILPHRYPFLLVDRVIEINGTDSAIGVKNVSFNEPHFQGHFPGSPIMPGVMIVEAMAQTAAVMVGVAQERLEDEYLIYFLGINNCKFRRKVLPGDVLKLHVSTLRSGAKIWRFQGRAEVEGDLAAEAEFNAMIDRQSG